MVVVKNGVTFVEILITIAVVAILAINSYLFLPSLINKANDARRKADLNKIKIFLENYYNDKNYYPRILPSCDELPCDPVTRSPYYYQVKGGQPQSYRLYTLLSNNQDTSIGQVGCSGGCGPDCMFNYGVSSTNVGLVRCSYVCAPGGGRTGSCELYNDPTISLCPKEYGKDATCNGECGDSTNKCQNASGKNIPY